MHQNIDEKEEKIQVSKGKRALMKYILIICQ